MPSPLKLIKPRAAQAIRSATVMGAVIAIRATVIVSTFATCCGFAVQAEDLSSAATPVPMKAFADISKHWIEQNPSTDKNNKYLKEHDIHGIAENLLIYQRNNGGWPINKHYLRVLNNSERQTIKNNKHRQDSSLDNRTTYPQIRYLMHAYKHSHKQHYLQGALKGFDYLFQHQYANGGFAHSPPSKNNYRAYITFADDVMPGVLSLLRDAANGASPFDVLPSQYSKKSNIAWRKGERLVLDLQIRIDGKPTIWAGQYHQSTLAPVQGRSFELPGLVSLESVSVIEYLMAEPRPSRRVKRAIIAGVKWLEKHKIEGLSVEKVAAKKVSFKHHNSTYDWVAKRKTGAGPVWARFYDLHSQKPFMATRDGTKVYKLKEIGRETRTGYAWYGTWPKKLLDVSYPKWLNKHGAKK